MKVFDNLKRKIQVLNMPVTFSDEDINLLAGMHEASGVGVKMRAGGIFTYSYYVPCYDSDLDLARDLFAKNGIVMGVHRSKLRFFNHGVVEIKKILRVRDRYSRKGSDTIDFIVKVQDKISEISKTENIDEWYKIQSTLSQRRGEYLGR